MVSYNERVAVCTLNRIFGFYPGISHTLIDNLGSAEAVFRLSGDELTAILGPFSRFREMIRTEELDRSDKELQRLGHTDGRFICIGEEAYPKALLECSDSPVGLYIRSEHAHQDIFNTHRAVAIVGTRDLSQYGSEWCYRIVEAIAGAKQKVLIVSGLAIGIDICAHRAALEFGLPTVGVMATGVDDVYPARHRADASSIASTPGCALVSDYPSGTSAVAINFLRRNRIIAGLCESTIVVESKLKGGAMMTANLAFGYGRNVFALPGRVDDERSKGCNYLIHRKIAEIIPDAYSCVESLGLGHPVLRSKASLKEAVEEKYSGAMPPETLGEYVSLALEIKKNRGISVDGLCSLTGMQYPQVRSMVTRLENDGFVETDLFQQCTIKAKLC